MPLNITPWMRDELEQRKQLYRDLFAGKPLERLLLVRGGGEGMR
jgi:hypothetical protein